MTVFADESEQTNIAVETLAAKLNVSPNLVYDAMKGIEPPAWVSPENFHKLKDAVLAFNKAANLASELHREMRKMSLEDTANLVDSGCATIGQIRILAEQLYEDADYYRKFQEDNPRPGGKRLDALNVARLVLNIFKILGKPITVAHTSGFPTTEYGYAVDFALAAFHVKADWRRAAEAAQQEHHNSILQTKPPQKKLISLKGQLDFITFELASIQTRTPLRKMPHHSPWMRIVKHIG